MSFWLYPYKSYTTGGTELIKELKGKKIKVARGKSKWKPNKNKVVINWGSRNFEALPANRQPITILNMPSIVARSANKLSFFIHMAANGLSDALPAFTVDKNEAATWVAKGLTVVARTVLNGHSGQGIIIVAPKGKNELPDAPLYTVYHPKDQEYRLHFIKDKTGLLDNFYNQRKVKRAGYEGKANRFVRCFDNGYTYQHNDITIPDVVSRTAATVFTQSGLDFGAVDIIYCKKEKGEKAYVLEINTAPGLENSSVKQYAEVFKKYFTK